MAKYTVSHQCGHEQEHRLFGPGKQRDSKLAWLAGTLCETCYAEKLQKDRAAASAQAAEHNAVSGLPTLTGSPKQIAWAETIRSSTLAKLEQIAADVQKAFGAAVTQEHEDYANRKISSVDLTCLAPTGLAILVILSSENFYARRELQDLVELVASEIRNRSEARWWIDYRGFERETFSSLLGSRIATACPTLATILAARREASHG